MKRSTVVLAAACIGLFWLSAPAHAAGTRTPAQAARIMLQTSTCYRQRIEWNTAACPVTTKLFHRLTAIIRYEQAHNMHSSADPICRCQQGPTSVRYSLFANDGRVAYIIAYRKYGTGNAWPLTFQIYRQSDGWRVNDVYCTHHHETSLYRQAVPGPCPSA